MTSSAARMTPTRRYFERRAEAFDRLYTRQSAGTRLLRVGPRRSRDLAVSVVARHKAPSVLDVGCGPGRVGEAVVEAGAASYVGVDFSPHMLRLARARLAGLESVRAHRQRLLRPRASREVRRRARARTLRLPRRPGASCGLDAGPLRRDARRHLQPAGPDQDSDSTAPLRGGPPLPDLLLRRGRCRGAASRRGLCARRVRRREGREASSSLRAHRREDRARPAAAAQRVRQALGAVRGSRDRLRREFAACRPATRSTCWTASWPT